MTDNDYEHVDDEYIYNCDKDDCKEPAAEYRIVGVLEDGSDAVFYLCDEHVAGEGFCLMCGYFVLGTGLESSLFSSGVCSECLDDLKHELGEYDDYDDYDY